MPGANTVPVVNRKRKAQSRESMDINLESGPMWKYEQKTLTERIAKKFPKVQRNEECAKFPLMKLPHVILIEIAKKLNREDRRFMMQSCTKSRRLLYGKKAKELECRVRVDVHVGMRQAGNDLLLGLVVHKMGTKNGKRARFWNIAVGTSSTEVRVVPADVEAALQEIAREFDVHLLHAHVCKIPDNEDNNIRLAIADFLEKSTKYLSTQLDFEWDPDRAERMINLFLGCPRSISLLADRASEDSSKVRRDRWKKIKDVKTVAAQRGIPLTFLNSGPETDMVFRLTVSEENERTLTVSGVTFLYC